MELLPHANENKTSKYVLVYRDTLLSYSETFIPAQVESFSSYSGFYVGVCRYKGSEFLVPFNKSAVLSEMVSLPQIWRLLFRLNGVIQPSWLNIIKTYSPRIMHAHFGSGGVWALPLARELRVPLIVTFHGADITIRDFNQTKSRPLDLLYIIRRKLLFKEARLCIAVSEFIRSELIKKGCPEEKILVHYIGVDVDKFRADNSLLRIPIVLFVGRLVEKKGCKYLIQAMAHVQKVMPEAELIVIGDGPLRLSLEQQAGVLLRRYRFLGAQPPQVVQEWMNRATVFSVPSIVAESGDAEGFGIVFSEAQAMGLPVVSFATGGVSEAVAHGETGFLTTERDWKGLAEYILCLMKDPPLWQRFSLNGQKRVQTNFNLKRQTQILEDIYNTILQGGC